MQIKKKLLEAKPESPEVQAFMEQAKKTYHPFIEAWMKNYNHALKEGEIEPGALLGTSDTAIGTSDVAATLEIFNAVIRGYTRYLDDSFVRKYVTDKVTFKIPLTEYTEAVSVMSATGEFDHSEKTIDYATVDLSDVGSEKGAKVTWTRALLEDVTFDVQAEMAEGLGHAIAVRIMQLILVELLEGAVWEASHGATTGDYLLAMPEEGAVTISDPITWEEFLQVVGAVDRGIEQEDGTFKTYGPADFALVSPDIYWQLLNIIQMTNVLYEGSTDPVKKGVIRLALGVTIVKQSLLPSGTIVALNSEKAIGLVTRRSLKIEPIIFPVWNEYGFLGTIRCGVTALFPGAVQLGQVAA